MQKLYIKTNTAVMVYAGVFVVAIALLAWFGISSYLRKNAPLPRVAMEGIVNNTSGFITDIAGSVITVEGVHIDEPPVDMRYLPPDAMPEPLPTRLFEVYVTPETLIWKDAIAPPGQEEIPEGAEPPSGSGMRKILLKDLKVGDYVNVVGGVDISDLRSFDAVEIKLVDLSDTTQP